MTLTTKGFYLLRAAECSRDAAAADLSNVRERFLRAERVWLGLADRVADPERSWKARP